MKNEEFATALSSPLRGGVRGGLLLLCLLLASCASKKHVTSTTTTATSETTTTVSPSQDNNQSANAKPQEQTCITARMRLDLSSGGKDVSVGGTLRMKRNNVIQLLLTTFGILEVARIEMTPEYFMLIDNVNRQYVKSAYSDVSLLRNANIDFYTIQTYFWDEQTSNLDGWERKDFVNIAGKSLPSKHIITIPHGSRTTKAKLTLSNFNTDSEWETRTQEPTRYSKVQVDELFSHIMNLTR